MRLKLNMVKFIPRKAEFMGIYDQNVRMHFHDRIPLRLAEIFHGVGLELRQFMWLKTRNLFF